MLHPLVEAAGTTFVPPEGKHVDLSVVTLEHLPGAVRGGVVDDEHAVGSTVLDR
jgi:hypothetical protein